MLPKLKFVRNITKAEARAQGVRRPLKRPRPVAVEGLPGVDGEPGSRGRPGKAGKDGAAGSAGAKGKDGKQGQPGPKGDPGAPGKDGASWIQNDRLPAANDGKDGDQWFRPSSGEVLLKRGGRWTVTATLRGRRGAPGPTGPKGADGNRFLYGFGAPAGGRSGDSWFDLEIGDLWTKQRDGWHKIFNLGARAHIGEGEPTESPHDAEVDWDFG